MNILFVHQNFPGQFKHLAPAMASQGHRVVALHINAYLPVPSVELMRYHVAGRHGVGTQRWLRVHFVLAHQRAFAEEHYDLETRCLPEQMAWIQQLATLNS